MLNPDIRHLLTDGLRPPTGWRIDAAIATTYTLDLTSLLLAPLSMAAYDQSEGGIEGAAPHELLEAIRRYAERTTVLLPGGRHPRAVDLSQAHGLRGGLGRRGRSAARAASSIRRSGCCASPTRTGEFTHRLLVLSRNLTGDRSWDTVLMVEEDASLPGQMAPTRPLTSSTP